jgi:phosphoribosylformylglycinamidine synthase subunit PurQ / glutaminase
MKFGVVVFPGSNCDDDMVYVLGELLGHPVVKLWHKNTDLADVDVVVLPGGFSYGDYVRAGAIARFSPIMNSVQAFAAQGGLVFGVCNGFQILCESHLLPGVLLRNANQQFICDNVWLKTDSLQSPITAQLSPGSVFKIPIAHAEGRYYADAATLDHLEANGQVLFRYCTPDGQVTAEANPNGAERNIAGICNEGRNVFGMMPHPERAATDILGNTDGLAIFESLLAQALVV